MFNSPGKRTVASMVAALPASLHPVSHRKVDHNTLEWTTAGGVRVIRLHTTDILFFPPKGGFTVKTGGYNTHTTRDRLKAFLPSPWTVFTRRGTIHLRNMVTDESHPFDETVTVTRSGKVVSDHAPAKDTAQRKRIDAYLKLYRDKGLPTLEMSGGDPWLFGNPKVSVDVMRDWIASRYRFRLMYVLALRFAGMQDEGIAISLMMIDRNGGRLGKIDLSRIRRFVSACLGRAA